MQRSFVCGGCLAALGMTRGGGACERGVIFVPNFEAHPTTWRWLDLSIEYGPHG